MHLHADKHSVESQSKSSFGAAADQSGGTATAEECSVFTGKTTGHNHLPRTPSTGGETGNLMLPEGRNSMQRHKSILT